MIALFGLVAVAGVLLLAYQRKETLLEHQGSEGVSLYHRMQGTKSVETKARLSLPVAGLLTVLKHPFSGGSEMDYQEMAQGLPAITDYHGFSGDVPASHNNYIGAGRRAGMLGWAIIGAILFQLWRMMTPLKLLESRLSYEAGMFLGTRAALLASLVNALFHNAGITTGEVMTGSDRVMLRRCGHCSLSASTVIKPRRFKGVKHRFRAAPAPLSGHSSLQSVNKDGAFGKAS